MTTIPNYALYGEIAQPVWNDALHVESISLRSGAHNWEIAAHRHEGLVQILYLQSGGGHVLFDSDTLHAKSPCVIIVPAQIVHGFHWDGAVEGVIITAVQHPLESMASMLSPTLQARLFKPRVIEMPNWSNVDDPLLGICRSLREEYHNRAQDHIACSMSLMLGLMVQILRHAKDEPHPGNTLPSRRSQKITQFREHVDMHFREHRTLTYYADELGITIATLSRLCQEQLGMTPMTLINARIILDAQRELAHSGLSVKQIAHYLGFSDVAYFSRFFRKHTRLSPSQFRERLNKG